MKPPGDRACIGSEANPAAAPPLAKEGGAFVRLVRFLLPRPGRGWRRARAAERAGLPGFPGRRVCGAARDAAHFWRAQSSPQFGSGGLGCSPPLLWRGETC